MRVKLLLWKTILLLLVLSPHFILTSSAEAAPDYGDAPDPPYPSLLARDGARHIDFSSEWLGAKVDGEANSRQIDADKFDDGVEIWLEAYPPTIPTPRIIVTISTSLQPGRYAAAANQRIYVRGWIDWDMNGEWGPLEVVFDWNGGPGVVGSDGQMWPAAQASRTITQTLVVPPGFGPPGTFARFRLTYGAIAAPTGRASFGEVEDYALAYVTPVGGIIISMDKPALLAPGMPWIILAVAVMVAAVSVAVYKKKYRGF